MIERRRIFEDASGKRWRYTKAALSVLGGLALLVCAGAIVGALVPADLPALPLTMGSVPVVMKLLSDASPAETAEARTARYDDSSAAPLPRRQAFQQVPFVRSTFVVQADPSSVESLRAHVAQLDVVFPDWLSFANAKGEVEVNINAELAASLKAAGVFVLPRISNTNAVGEWYTSKLGTLFRSAGATETFIDEVVTSLQRGHADGVNLDIEGIRPADKQAFVEWLDTIADALHARGFIITVDVPLNDEAYDLEAIGKISDAVVLMAYDQHFATGKAGPIAGRDWFDEGIADVLGSVPRDKLIVGIGAYGYDWTEGGGEAVSLGFDEAVRLAARAGVQISTDATAVNSRFDYQDEAGRSHHVWLLDAVSAWNEVRTVQRNQARGLALWRAGLEDGVLWSFFGGDSGRPFDAGALERLPPPRVLSSQGSGELFLVSDQPDDGSREIEFESGDIVWAALNEPPHGFRLDRPQTRSGKRIALTFDDGPDPLWTPQILRVLARYGVHATFFVVGDQAERYPNLLTEEMAAGNLIGNHTYLHPQLSEISNARLTWEVNATQRLIQAVTGHSTVLFRAPYDADSEPTSAAQLYPLRQVTRMGYLLVGADIDSEDYARPGADRIVENVLTRVRDEDAHVVVFHDAGGDRGQTVEALEKLIPQLLARGYRLVGLEDFVDSPSVSLMPSIAGFEHGLAVVRSVTIWFRIWGWKLLLGLFFVTTAMSVIRIASLAVLILRGKSAARMRHMGDFMPEICVLIPAHNEAKVIAKTLAAVLKSDYPQFHVAVIDDGSTDGTAEIVAECAKTDARLTLIRQPSCRGKAAALNRGFRERTEDYIVTIDADTIVLPHTVRKLMEPFSDLGVDAVCGNVQVGNLRNTLTKFQHVEYVTSQNYDRRAFDGVNCISVVPGATGAWKRRKVLEIGGYSEDTLTEDTDLTLTLLGRGGRVVYAAHGQSVTEAPETISALFRQRYRWSFGSMQCLWKHRNRCGRGSLGLIVLPNIFLFQILFPMLAPLGDGLLVSCVLRRELMPVAVGYMMFLAMDLVSSVIAFRLDGQNFRDASVIVIQRFFYRQLMYAVTFAGLLGVLRGRRHGWNKLHRMGTCPLPAVAAHCQPNLSESGNLQKQANAA